MIKAVAIASLSCVLTYAMTGVTFAQVPRYEIRQTLQIIGPDRLYEGRSVQFFSDPGAFFDNMDEKGLITGNPENPQIGQ
ncbi:MAG TPA: hypothetical protein VEQ35_08780 [Beijerinckia sp.]|jgi:hypothetical protein|nr:hypothetical protein [Beijerinckia sp.]